MAAETRDTGAAGPTPGPWYLDGEHTIRAKSGQRIADLWFTVSTFKAADANARLIASAPDLLAALQGILDVFGRDATDAEEDAALSAARAALSASRPTPTDGDRA